MSRPGESGAPSVRPIVYHPDAEPDPSSYEQYADPAAAHGWQNAYDETQRLPRVPAAGPPRLAGEPVAGGRADRRRAARRTGGGRSRRFAVAAGAVGAVSLAALVAGLSFTSGSPADGRQDKRGNTRSAHDGTVSPSGSPSGTPSSTGESAASGVPTTPSSGSTTSSAPSVTASAGTPGGPATTVAPSVTASPSWSTPGGTQNPGRGHGKGGGKPH
ncbi:hypothetical protein [Streptomyces sp. NBC_00582]|uniref:hypothetical protein n=1 Tax=Streptomyces sp. NBC_00582 TaxID=2975783 RepID=UPI002E8215D5|nr:hypothetical protein [Streptomyces sp. NBC_00582]WUB62235.1 hypothetical protein OG852_18450 [Streptomyces sp. NBC_00582]